jgi:hypothetical protein
VPGGGGGGGAVHTDHMCGVRGGSVSESVEMCGSFCREFGQECVGVAAELKSLFEIPLATGETLAGVSRPAPAQGSRRRTGAVTPKHFCSKSLQSNSDMATSHLRTPHLTAQGHKITYIHPPARTWIRAHCLPPPGTAPLPQAMPPPCHVGGGARRI